MDQNFNELIEKQSKSFLMILSSIRNKFIKNSFVAMNNNSSRHNSINATIFPFRVYDISINLYVIIQLNLNHFATEKTIYEYCFV